MIVRSDNVFFSHKLDNNCSDTSAGKKASGCLKVSRVAELVGASLDDVLPVVVSKANSSVLLLFTVQISGRSKTYGVFNSAGRQRGGARIHALVDTLLTIKTLTGYGSTGGMHIRVA